MISKRIQINEKINESDHTDRVDRGEQKQRAKSKSGTDDFVVNKH